MPSVPSDRSKGEQQKSQSGRTPRLWGWRARTLLILQSDPLQQYMLMSTELQKNKVNLFGLLVHRFDFCSA